MYMPSGGSIPFLLALPLPVELEPFTGDLQRRCCSIQISSMTKDLQTLIPEEVVVRGSALSVPFLHIASNLSPLHATGRAGLWHLTVGLLILQSVPFDSVRYCAKG